MAKFYVASGEFRDIISGDSAEVAIISSFRRAVDKDDMMKLSFIVTASEMGFSVHGEDTVFLTEEMLNMAGVADEFD